MFSLNQKVVYPGHGVAVIHRIVQKNIGDNSVLFFELKLLHKDMTVLVPVDSESGACIRVLSTDRNVTEVFDLIAHSSQISCEITASNWSKRHKDYQAKLRTGNMYEVGKMYCELLNIASVKGLSFGEKNLLKQIERFLAEEIASVMNIEYDNVIEQMRTLYANSKVACIASQPQSSSTRQL